MKGHHETWVAAPRVRNFDKFWHVFVTKRLNDFRGYVEKQQNQTDHYSNHPILSAILWGAPLKTQIWSESPCSPSAMITTRIACNIEQVMRDKRSNGWKEAFCHKNKREFSNRFVACLFIFACFCPPRHKWRVFEVFFFNVAHMVLLSVHITACSVLRCSQWAPPTHQRFTVSLVILWSYRGDEEKKMHKATRASKWNRGFLSFLFPSIDLGLVPKCWKLINSPTPLEFFGDICENIFVVEKLSKNALLFHFQTVKMLKVQVKASCESACVS